MLEEHTLLSRGGGGAVRTWVCPGSHQTNPVGKASDYALLAVPSHRRLLHPPTRDLKTSHKLKKSVRKVLFLYLPRAATEVLVGTPLSPLRHPQMQIIPQKRQKTPHQHFGREFFPNLNFCFILNLNSREFTPQRKWCFPFLLKKLCELPSRLTKSFI